MTYSKARKIVDVMDASRINNPSAFFNEQKAASLNTACSLQIDIEVELDLGCYFYTVRDRDTTIGIYSTYDNQHWRASSIYNDNKKTFHKISTEARAAIISAYVKQPIVIPEVDRVTYHVTLETSEVDEAGITFEHRTTVTIDEDAYIDWLLWVKRYSDELGENFRLVRVDRIDNNSPEEF